MPPTVGGVRYCRTCGKIDPALKHPLGGCTCTVPDFSPARGSTAAFQIELDCVRQDLAEARQELADQHALMMLFAAERDQWRSAHASVVGAKRRLSEKYGRIMRNKPAARWRRLKKKIRRTI